MFPGFSLTIAIHPATTARHVRLGRRTTKRLGEPSHRPCPRRAAARPKSVPEHVGRVLLELVTAATGQYGVLFRLDDVARTHQSLLPARSWVSTRRLHHLRAGCETRTRSPTTLQTARGSWRRNTSATGLRRIGSIRAPRRPRRCWRSTRSSRRATHFRATSPTSRMRRRAASSFPSRQMRTPI